MDVQKLKVKNQTFKDNVEQEVPITENGLIQNHAAATNPWLECAIECAQTLPLGCYETI
jgi:hypothetical protein